MPNAQCQSIHNQDHHIETTIHEQERQKIAQLLTPLEKTIYSSLSQPLIIQLVHQAVVMLYLFLILI